MNISDIIEKFIIDKFYEDTNVILKRNELAAQFNCAPSQINYVISTRFTNEMGYIVESRRGGGGYIIIKRISVQKSDYFMHIINVIGSSINYKTLQALVINMQDQDLLTKREAIIITAVLNDNMINAAGAEKDRLRATVFKNILAKLVNSKDGE